MYYRYLIFILILISLTANSQICNKYRWKHLGPFTTPQSTANFGSWTATGQGWIEDVLITDKYWYAAAMTGGVYRTKNEGKNWKKVDADSIQLGTQCLYEYDNTIYRGAGRTHHGQDFGIGVLKSSDNGKSWRSSGLTFNNTEQKVVWDIEGNNRKLFALTDSELWYADRDSLDKWTLAYTAKDEDLRSVICDTKDDLHVIIAGKELYETTDGGVSFQIITKRLSLPASNNDELQRIAICQDQNTTTRWLAFYGGRRKSYVDQSLDNGKTWSNIYANREVDRADRHHTEISLVPNHTEVIVLGTFRSYVSRDSGRTFSVSTLPVRGNKKFAHDDIRGITTNADGTIFLASDGGVFSSTDAGATWKNNSGKGLVVNQAYGIHLLSNDNFLIGCQDLGYMHYTKGDWKHLGRHYGDGGDALSTDRGVYLLVGGRIRLVDSITSEKYRNLHPRDRSNPFVAHFSEHPIDSSSFYYLGNNVWKNTNNKWTNLTEDIKGEEQPIRGFDINPKNPNQLFFSFDQPTWSTRKLIGKFFRSMDGGQTWKDITINLPIAAWHSITSVVSNPQNPNEVYASLGLMDTDQLNKVYKSTDGGDTWTNYSAGLPKYETIKVAYLKGANTLVLSTVAGLYYRGQYDKKWKLLSGQIPRIEVRDFEIDQKGKYLYAATYGNGVWRMKIPRKWYKD
jgi:photosystem II stability/assembly factor-like uncharacterized protein